MSTCGIEMRHWCGGKGRPCDTNVPQLTDREYFCHAPHPDTEYNEALDTDVPVARCMRQPDHDGPHSAFTFSISEATEWVAA